MNQSIHGGWDSANGPVSPRRNRLCEWTRTPCYFRFVVSWWQVGAVIPVERVASCQCRRANTSLSKLTSLKKLETWHSGFWFGETHLMEVYSFWYALWLLHLELEGLSITGSINDTWAHLVLFLFHRHGVTCSFAWMLFWRWRHISSVYWSSKDYGIPSMNTQDYGNAV